MIETENRSVRSRISCGVMREISARVVPQRAGARPITNHSINREFSNSPIESTNLKSQNQQQSPIRNIANSSMAGAYPLRICRIGSGFSFVPNFQHVLHALQS